ncbi:Glutaredoxin-like [Dillenia turbinata]|uniref:Glutaredoxin-like protein n=1 Tax=Dillenia turbinata TaxID=194707 RepID=A0AAN8ZJ62_9MAGN
MGAGTVIGPISISMSRGLWYATQKSTLAFFKSHSAVASFSSSASVGSNSRKLILYSKPGCCLCDGLKEKLHAAFSLSSPHSLQDVHLEVRDITSKVEWEQAYQYEIPVLARALPDGSEEILPRLSPRLGVEHIQKKLATALRQ